MNDNRITIDPRIAADTLAAIEKHTGVDCHVIIIALPDLGGWLGSPSFATSLDAEQVAPVIVKLAQDFPTFGNLVVTGSYTPEDDPDAPAA